MLALLTVSMSAVDRGIEPNFCQLFWKPVFVVLFFVARPMRESVWVRSLFFCPDFSRLFQNFNRQISIAPNPDVGIELNISKIYWKQVFLLPIFSSLMHHHSNKILTDVAHTVIPFSVRVELRSEWVRESLSYCLLYHGIPRCTRVEKCPKIPRPSRHWPIFVEDPIHPVGKNLLNQSPFVSFIAWSSSSFVSILLAKLFSISISDVCSWDLAVK